MEEEQKGQERAQYGVFLIKALSKRLQVEFGEGFNTTNLKRMRQFYLTYPKGAAMRHLLSWTHYRILIRVQNVAARSYYEKAAVEQNWNTRALERQIGTMYYERLLASKDKKAAMAEAEENTKTLYLPKKSFNRNYFANGI